MLKKELEGIMSRYIFIACLPHSVYINFRVGLYFLFYFNFLILDLGLGVSMILYITVTYPSHVTVIVTQSYVTQKNIESSRTMILYSMFTIY